LDSVFAQTYSDFEAIVVNEMCIRDSRLAENAYLESQKYRWEVVREQWLKVYRDLAKSQ